MARTRKLTDEQIAEIRASTDTQLALAARYNIAQSAISRVRRNVYCAAADRERGLVNHIMKRYGVSREKARAHLATKPSTCQVCPGTLRIADDHCHSTKRHRGWLCEQCNRALGLVHDDPKRLRALADYLDTAAT